MSAIDPRTVLVLTGVMSVFMAVILFSLKRSYPPSIKGLGEWSVTLLMVSAGGLLGFGLGTLPDWVSISVPRLLLPCAMLVAYVGTQRFLGVQPRIWPWATLIAVVVLAQAWFTLVVPSFQMRLLLATGLAASLFVANARVLQNRGAKSYTKLITTGLLWAMTGIVLMRFVSAILLPVGENILDTSPQNMLYVTSFCFCILLWSVGMVLMASERLHTEVAYLASHDSLTNALTRRHLNQVCAIELDRSARHGYSMALLVMDLDHFKVVNDSHGHQQGDLVLVEFVGKVQGLLRLPDQLGRFGGEEFVAMLPETSLQEASLVAERVRAACARPSAKPSCTVSIGVTTNHTAGDTVDALFARADAAMYRAKANGRNRVETA